MSNIDKAKIKVTIAKLIELSIDTDKDVTLAIMRQKGSAKLSVDQNGKVTVSGSGKRVIFSGDPALRNIGFKLKAMSITFNNMDGMRVGYTGSVSGPFGVTISLSGSFDLEQLITACTGLLCQAARRLVNRDQQLQQIMGY